MTETKPDFAVGDSVISVSCVVAPPTEPHGVRLEIPLACRGRVIDVRPYEFPQPYVVAFEVPEAGNVVVEVDVTHEQIAKVNSPEQQGAEQLVQLVRMNPRALHRRLHEPSKGRPHADCLFWHRFQWVGMAVALLFTVAQSPVVATGVIALLVAVLYGHHLVVHGRLDWVPDILWPDAPNEDERLDVDFGLMKQVFISDVVFSASVAAVVVNHFVNPANSMHRGAVVSIMLSLVALGAYLYKLSVHEKAVRIVPDI